MRITGLASGLDMDEILKNSMKPYRIKIDKKGQGKEILEIKQKLYREVIKDSRELYNKYFDVTNSKSLLLSKNWSSVKFTSSNENLVSVTGTGDAKADNYTITGKVAKANQISISSGIEENDKLVVNGKEFILKGDTAKERANNLNNELKAAGINVSVKYTDFAATSGANKSGFVFESTVLGKDNNFTIGGTFSDNKGTVVKGIDATASTITSNSFTVDALKAADGKIKIGDKEIQLSSDILDDPGLDNSDIEKALQNELKDSKLTAEIDENGNIIFKTTALGSKIEDPKISINGVQGTFTPGIDATHTTNTLELSEIADNKITINGSLVDLTGKNSEDEVVNHLNKILKEQNLGVTASIKDGKVLLTSNVAGSKPDINLKIAGNDIQLASGGEYAEITIKNSKGGVYTHSGLTNSLTLDGVNFKFTGDIPSEGVTVNGKQDATGVKDNLVKFLNDYNNLIEKLNTLTTDKRNRNFDPLTADQKKEMSADEIKLWNEKVEKGQLSRDSDLTRISNSLKQAMRGLVDGTELNLEKIGINPALDYQGTKNGTFTIDEDKLTKALEENSEEIMNMFIKSEPKDETLSAGQKYAKTGLMQRIKSILYNETVTVASPLLKKAGIEGSLTAVNNDLTKSIKQYEQKMADMEKGFLKREQALYSKYAKLETIMNKYNSQQSYLMQQLGLN